MSREARRLDRRIHIVVLMKHNEDFIWGSGS